MEHEGAWRQDGFSTQDEPFLFIYKSVHDFVDGGLLVAGAGHDILVVRRYVATQHRR